MISPYTLFALLGSCFILYRLCIAGYRILLHPLRKFPGPRLAGATTLYRAWYQIVTDGRQLQQWDKLHTMYGDIVRIAPNQLHFSDPRVFDEVTNFSTVCVKDDDFWHFTGQNDALLGMSDERKHRERFKLVSSLFSSEGIRRFEPTMIAHTNRLCQLLAGAREGPINMAFAARALFLDTVLDFVFDDVPRELRSLQDLSFSCEYLSSSYNWMDWTGTWPRRNFPVLVDFLIGILPGKLLKILLPGIHAGGNFTKFTEDMIRQRLSSTKWSRDCFLARFPRDWNPENLLAECSATILGGIIDPSNVLQYGLFHICSDAVLQARLFEEIATVWQGPTSQVPTSALLNLPLLSGLVMESLRLTHGVLVGPPRVTPKTGVTIGGVWVPGGTSVTTSSTYSHLNSSVFPEPHAFIPDRWCLASPEMKRSICSFGKGRRQCPGRQLATNQLYIAFASLLYNFEFEACNTTIHDMELKAYLSAHFTGRQFHVRIKSRRQA